MSPVRRSETQGLNRLLKKYIEWSSLTRAALRERSICLVRNGRCFAQDDPSEMVQFRVFQQPAKPSPVYSDLRHG